MTKQAASATRAGQASAPHEDRRSHILVVFADDRHGALDRIIGLLRRRRSNMQTLTIGRSEVPNVVRITVMMDDSEVGVEQLVEQLRKIVDVRHVVNLPIEQAVSRELALIKVNSKVSQQPEIIELGHLYGAHPVDMDQETVTLEVTGSADKVEKLVAQLQPYGVREVARTGCLAMTRGSGKI
ncbi:MAG: acetolactate synthase small subunit [Ktedonobacteraceae bacterium]